MQAPAGPIKNEARNAIAIGIRESGPRAVSILLIGLVRLFLALVVLLMFHLVGSEMFGFSLVSVPFAGVSVFSVALSLIATAGRRPDSDSPEEPTQDERRPCDESAEYGGRSRSRRSDR